MKTNETYSKLEDMKAKLSTLWIFVTLNYLYCDVLGLMDPESLRGFMAGNVGGIEVTQEFLLSASILMEIPMAMVLLSRVLNYRINRRANIIAGIFMTIVQISSLFFGSSPTSFYLFFSAVEITCTAAIAWYAWKSK